MNSGIYSHFILYSYAGYNTCKSKRTMNRVQNIIKKLYRRWYSYHFERKVHPAVTGHCLVICCPDEQTQGQVPTSSSVPKKHEKV